MRPKTNKEILEALQQLTPDQLEMTATFKLGDEFYPIYDTCLLSELHESDEKYGDLFDDDIPLLTSHIVIMSPTAQK